MLEQNINLLGEIIKNSKEQSKLEKYDLATINSSNKILKEEQVKLKEKEMLVVVVGTTSSGKSTFINALIGQKLLPKSNSAKTSIPIQIKHNPALDLNENKKPVLRFAKPEPLEALHNETHNKYNYISIEKLKSEIGFKGFEDILYGKATKPCEGADEIYEHLDKLSDFVRLSKNIIKREPLAGFKERANFPMIEVKFSSLPNLPEENGNFILMDSPGPNEANGGQIMKFVNELMGTASAVFPVIDFTQEGTAHEAEVKKAIGVIKKECPRSMDNIYAAVHGLHTPMIV